MVSTAVDSTSPVAQWQPGWSRVVVVAFSRGVVALVVMLLLWASLPALLGWTPQLILSGSMSPAIQPGDLVITKHTATSDLAVGRVVTVIDPDHPGRTRTHRIHAIKSGGFLQLKGDANPQPDSSTVSSTAVQGVGVLLVPMIGRPIYWLHQRNWAALGAAAAVLALCLGNLRTASPRGPPRGGRRHGRRRKAATQAAAIAAVTATAVMHGGEAEAAYRTTSTNPTSTLAVANDFYPYRTAVNADTPLMYWRLEETSGTTAADTTTNGRTGTYRGTFTLAQPSALAAEPARKSIALNQGYVTANTSTTAPTTFTVEAWVKTTSTAGGRVIGFGDQGGSTFSATVDRQLYLAPNGKAVFGVGNKVAITSPSAVNDGTWHYLAGTYSSATGMRLYVDGALAATGTSTPTSMTGYWRAGAETPLSWPSAPTSNYLNGSLDEVAVYSTALSSTRITAHYSAGATP